MILRMTVNINIYTCTHCSIQHLCTVIHIFLKHPSKTINVTQNGTLTKKHRDHDPHSDMTQSSGQGKIHFLAPSGISSGSHR